MFYIRPIQVRIFDLLFVAAWIGLVIIIIWIFGSLLSSISGKSVLPKLLYDSGTRILLVTVALWIGLFIATLVFSNREDRFDQFRNHVWRRILLMHFIMVTGPTAYYIGYLRRRIASDAGKGSATFIVKGQQKSCLDILYFILFWGTLGLFCVFGALFLLPNGPIDARGFFVMGTIVVMIPLIGLATMLLNVFLVIDAASRPQDQWEKTNFLRMLNPWAGVFGMRKYYLHFLGPEIEMRKSLN